MIPSIYYKATAQQKKVTPKKFTAATNPVMPEGPPDLRSTPVDPAGNPTEPTGAWADEQRALRAQGQETISALKTAQSQTRQAMTPTPKTKGQRMMAGLMMVANPTVYYQQMQLEETRKRGVQNAVRQYAEQSLQIYRVAAGLPPTPEAEMEQYQMEAERGLQEHVQRQGYEDLDSWREDAAWRRQHERDKAETDLAGAKAREGYWKSRIEAAKAASKGKMTDAERKMLENKQRELDRIRNDLTAAEARLQAARASRSQFGDQQRGPDEIRLEGRVATLLTQERALLKDLESTTGMYLGGETAYGMQGLGDERSRALLQRAMENDGKLDDEEVNEWIDARFSELTNAGYGLSEEEVFLAIQNELQQMGLEYMGDDTAPE